MRKMYMIGLNMSRFYVPVIAILALCGNALSDLVPWSPSWLDTPRDDLKCNVLPSYPNCDQKSRHYNLDKCCTCLSSTNWEGQEINMIVEYVSVLSKTVILTKGLIDISHVYKVEYKNSEMTEIPSNICNWDTSNRIETSYSRQYTDIKSYWAHIVRLNFAGSQIQQVVDLNCLSRLDTLELQNNRISYLSNTSFQSLSALRNINFANNLITVIDPYVILSLGLFLVDISNNSLSSVDVTNLLSFNPFCYIDFEYNQIKEIINQVDFKLITDGSRKYGPGIVNISNNMLNTFPDFTEILRLDTAAQVGTFFSASIDLRGTELNCDCHVYPYVKVYERFLQSFWYDFLNVTCHSPPKFKDKLVHRIPHEELVCPIGAEGNCPKGCECIIRPADYSLLVNCSNRKLTELPNKLPETKHTKFIHLDVSFNSITEISNASYISKIKHLDISHNNLKFINITVLKGIDVAIVSRIDISYNENLHELPHVFQYLNACKVHTENLIIECDCESLWIVYWLKAKGCQNDKTMFYCHVPTKGMVYGPDFREDQIDCVKDESPIVTITTVSLAIITLLAIIITIVGYTFRYEIMIIWLGFRKRSINSMVPTFTFDAFLSFDDDNEDLFLWVSRSLLPYLEQAGYKLFLPVRDLAFGDVRDTETIDILSKTRNFLLILSESYFDPDGHSWIDNEWKYGWNMFKYDKFKNLVIVNYDHMSSFDVYQPQIKAFLRVGAPLEFLNRDSQIFENVSRKLGRPYKNKYLVPNEQLQPTSANEHDTDSTFLVPNEHQPPTTANEQQTTDRHGLEMIQFSFTNSSSPTKNNSGGNLATEGIPTISKSQFHERFDLTPARSYNNTSNYLEYGDFNVSEL